MFLGGTIVLSIAASFFGATGIMGLKYLQNDCYDEVELFFKSPAIYMTAETKEYAEESIVGTYDEWTNEHVYNKYGKTMISQSTMFKETNEALTSEPFFIYTVVSKFTTSRLSLLQKFVRTADYKQTIDPITNIRTLEIETGNTAVTCFDSSPDGFSSFDGLIICPIRYSNVQSQQARYEESTEQIIAAGTCAYDEAQTKCDKDSISFPLCCSQFDSSVTVDKDCHCFDALNDASCGFETTCTYAKTTLDLSVNEQRQQWCVDNASHKWCVKETVNSAEVWAWDRECDDKTSADDILTCCKSLEQSKFSHSWTKYGVNTDLDMTPTKCKTAGVYQCMKADQFYGGCCDDSTHSKCTECKAGPTANTVAAERAHATACGYSDCLSKDFYKKQKCCAETEKIYGITFGVGTQCEAAINYKACDDKKPTQNSKSLACAKATEGCKSTDKCFPDCCSELQFDFSTQESITLSLATDCYKSAPHLIEPLNDKENLMGQYIYHHTDLNCQSSNGIIQPKCCNRQHLYTEEDPCYCTYLGTSSYFDGTLCEKIHIKDCHPGNNEYPQCCFDIGNSLFGDNDFCSCRLNQNPKNPDTECNDGPSEGNKFEAVRKCPNPCKDKKALLPDKSFICEKPVYIL